MKCRRCIAVGIYWMVSCCISAIVPSSTAAFTTALVVHRRFHIKLLHHRSVVFPRTCNVRFQHRNKLLIHPNKLLISVDPHAWKLWGVNDEDDYNKISNSNMLQNSTTLIDVVVPNNANNNKTTKKTEFDWDTFLDTPFFDPNMILNDPNSNTVLKQLASWVQEDYETVEVIVTATLFIFLIVVTQELLRIQIYGIENYVPFTKGIRPGSLF